MGGYERIALEELVLLARNTAMEGDIRLKAAQTLLGWVKQGGEEEKEES